MRYVCGYTNIRTDRHVIAIHCSVVRGRSTNVQYGPAVPVTLLSALAFILSNEFLNKVVSIKTTRASSCRLLGSRRTYSMRAFCFGRRALACLSVCLCRVRSRKLSKIGVKFRRLYRKLRSPNKNMMPDFAPEVAKYSKSSPKPPNIPK